MLHTPLVANSISPRSPVLTGQLAPTGHCTTSAISPITTEPTAASELSSVHSPVAPFSALPSPLPDSTPAVPCATTSSAAAIDTVAHRDRSTESKPIPPSTGESTIASTIVASNPEPDPIDNPLVQSRTDELDIRQSENLQRAVDILALGIVRHIKQARHS